jgi:hypothetical protein
MNYRAPGDPPGHWGGIDRPADVPERSEGRSVRRRIQNGADCERNSASSEAPYVDSIDRQTHEIFRQVLPRRAPRRFSAQTSRGRDRRRSRSRIGMGRPRFAPRVNLAVGHGCAVPNSRGWAAAFPRPRRFGTAQPCPTVVASTAFFGSLAAPAHPANRESQRLRAVGRQSHTSGGVEPLHAARGAARSRESLIVREMRSRAQPSVPTSSQRLAVTLTSPMRRSGPASGTPMNRRVALRTTHPSTSLIAAAIALTK